jgi:hypothetical protein
MNKWKIIRFGHASKGKDNTTLNNELRNSLSRKRITVSLQYVSTNQLSYRKLSKDAEE